MFNFPLDQDNESLLALASRITTLVSRQLCEPRGTDAQEAPGPSWGGGGGTLSVGPNLAAKGLCKPLWGQHRPGTDWLQN